jgi:antitoxin YefM
MPSVPRCATVRRPTTLPSVTPSSRRSSPGEGLEHQRVVITKHGRPAAVVVSVDDLESLEETLDILSRPALIKQIRASLDDLGGQGAEVLSKDEVLALIQRP